MTEQPKTVTISETEYLELKRAAESWSKYRQANAERAKKANSSLTPEQRSERARKAVEARIAKYGQNKRK